MAHISLYRRFRPTSFGEMVRQEHIVRILKNQIEKNAVGHAYLFCGPRGTGKTSVARIFARTVNCESPIDGSPCGKCPTCRALEGGSLDISEIDAASNNGVAEMRDLREKVQYPPVSGRYKVYIVDEVHMLTDSAFNALLKTLEEPPAHAIFILATTEPHKIPATILSRCMRLDFKLIPTEDLENHLKRILDELGKEYEEEAVSAIARAGAGSDRDMLSIAEACIAYSEKLTYEGVTAALGTADFQTTSRLAQALLHGEMPTVLHLAETLLSSGKSVGILLRDLMSLLSQIAIAKTCSNAEKLLSLPKDLFARVKEIADSSDSRAVLRATEIFAKTETELRYGSSPRIQFETAIMRISMPEAEENIDALLVRLSELERRLAATPMPLTGAYVPPQTERAVPITSETEISAEPREERYDEPPMPEEPPFEAFYGMPEEPATFEEQAPTPRVEKAPASIPKAPAKPLVAATEKPTAEVAFGKFLRMLRKTCKNGVLVTMCSDLVASYEGETLILTTDIEAVFRVLNREEHRKIMQEVFESVGISAFEVRIQKKPDKGVNAVESLRKDFSDYPIELK